MNRRPHTTTVCSNGLGGFLLNILKRDEREEAGHDKTSTRHKNNERSRHIQGSTDTMISNITRGRTMLSAVRLPKTAVEETNMAAR